ncbi:MAG: tetratricopeptide repeat protein, partial [Proteobacteria bacterium]|nr:tetratricopeptide repeat protein [Pseudomonadota bacterium]
MSYFSFPAVFRVAFLVLVFTPCLSPTTVVAEESIIQSAKTLLKNGKAEEAFNLLDPHLIDYAADPEFNYLLGIAALDAGKPGDAVFAFERVLAVDPGHLNARAELARAHMLLGETEAARRELTRVKEQQPPAAVSIAIDKHFAKLDRFELEKRAQGRKISAYGEVSVGHDDNINSGTDDSVVKIPLLGNLPFQLARISVKGSSPFEEARAGVDAEHTEGDTTFFGLANTGFRYHNRFSGFYTKRADGQVGL